MRFAVGSFIVLPIAGCPAPTTRTCNVDADCPDGQPYSAWALSQPTGDVAESCVAMAYVQTDEASPAQWLDDTCDTSNGFVCDVPDGATVDGCFVDVVGAARLAVCTIGANYDVARAMCLDAGALAIVEDADANAAIAARAASLGGATTALWIGLDDLVADGTYVRGDGMVVDVRP